MNALTKLICKQTRLFAENIIVSRHLTQFEKPGGFDILREALIDTITVRHKFILLALQKSSETNPGDTGAHDAVLARQCMATANLAIDVALHELESVTVLE